MHLASPNNPRRQFQTAYPEVIPGLGLNEDVAVYNVTTDFRRMEKAHKTYWVPKEPVVSRYADPDLPLGPEGRLLPDISSVPKPSELNLGPDQREQIINSGAIPEARPFMAGARIALAERRARRQQRLAKKALRSVHVIHNMAEGVLTNKTHSDIDNEFRPRTLKETAVAKRLERVFQRANRHNASSNIQESMHTHQDPETGEKRVEFERGRENMSAFEKARLRSRIGKHTSHRKKANSLMLGTRIRGTDKRIGLISFDGLTNRSINRNAKKAGKAVTKRNRAVRKAEALRRAQEARHQG